jgi:two-component system, NarL family, response regulator LiaR
MTIMRTGALGIYIIEEQEIYREIYQNVLEPEGDIKLLGVSSCGYVESLAEALTSTKPDVLIMGIKKISANLCDEIQQVRAHQPEAGLVLLVTSISSDEIYYLQKLVRKYSSGIAIYFKQSLDHPDQLHKIILSVSRGQVKLDPVINNLIMAENRESPLIRLLTDTELEVLDLIRQGLTNRGIANLLNKDIREVKDQVNNIYNKLKENSAFDQTYPRMSSARMLIETTGELKPIAARNVQARFPIF